MRSRYREADGRSRFDETAAAQSSSSPRTQRLTTANFNILQLLVGFPAKKLSCRFPFRASRENPPIFGRIQISRVYVEVMAFRFRSLGAPPPLLAGLPRAPTHTQLLAKRE
jgi:hypothetical protein